MINLIRRNYLNRTIKVYETATTELCPPHPEIMTFVIPSNLNYLDSDARCVSLGGSLLTVNDTGLIQKILSVSFFIIYTFYITMGLTFVISLLYIHETVFFFLLF